jgi:DNA-binding LacI/PurR family transcriptional regulator/DNA-binding transcriptional regulator YhcF (GntR family)
MKSFRPVSTSDQLAAHLREEIMSGGLSGTMPGVKYLVKTLGVNSRALTDAMKELEKEGILVGQGPRRQRLIVLPKNHKPPSLHIKLLLYEPYSKQVDYLLDLMHRLRELGHVATIASKTQMDFGMDTSKLERFVKKTNVDAWIIMSGSKQILQWFVNHSIPTFAIFGRMNQLQIAGAKLAKKEALICAIHRLYDLGHRRMVMLCQEDRRKPQPGAHEQVFLDELESLGIETSAYNLPDWSASTESFHQMLHTLFLHTPPSALLIDTSSLFNAAHQFLAQKKLRVPQDVSMLSADPDPSFEWSSPEITHIHWDPDPVIRHILRWAQNISQKKKDIRQKITPAQFIEGGTIGPVS